MRALPIQPFALVAIAFVAIGSTAAYPVHGVDRFDEAIDECIVVMARVEDQVPSGNASLNQFRVVIDHVYCGDAETGEEFFEYSLDENPGGGFGIDFANIVHPPLRCGQTGFWVLERDESGLLRKEIRRSLQVRWPIRPREDNAVRPTTEHPGGSLFAHVKDYRVINPSFARVKEFAERVEAFCAVPETQRDNLLGEFLASTHEIEIMYALRIMEEADPVLFHENGRRLLSHGTPSLSLWLYLDQRLARCIESEWRDSPKRNERIAAYLESSSINEAIALLSDLGNQVSAGTYSHDALVQGVIALASQKTVTEAQEVRIVQLLGRLRLDNEARSERVFRFCVPIMMRDETGPAAHAAAKLLRLFPTFTDDQLRELAAVADHLNSKIERLSDSGSREYRELEATIKYIRDAITRCRP
jgi:hypothetical protein